MLLLLRLPLVDGHNDLVLKICQFLLQLLQLAGQLLLLRLRQNDCALQLAVVFLQLYYPLVHFLVFRDQLVERNLIFIDYRCQSFVLCPQGLDVFSQLPDFILVDGVLLVSGAFDLFPEDPLLFVVESALHLSLVYRLLNEPPRLPLLAFAIPQIARQLLVYHLQLSAQLLLLRIFRQSRHSLGDLAVFAYLVSQDLTL